MVIFPFSFSFFFFFLADALLSVDCRPLVPISFLMWKGALGHCWTRAFAVLPPTCAVVPVVSCDSLGLLSNNFQNQFGYRKSLIELLLTSGTSWRVG